MQQLNSLQPSFSLLIPFDGGQKRDGKTRRIEQMTKEQEEVRGKRKMLLLVDHWFSCFHLKSRRIRCFRCFCPKTSLCFERRTRFCKRGSETRCTARLVLEPPSSSAPSYFDYRGQWVLCWEEGGCPVSGLLLLTSSLVIHVILLAEWFHHLQQSYPASRLFVVQ